MSYASEIRFIAKFKARTAGESVQNGPLAPRQATPAAPTRIKENLMTREKPQFDPNAFLAKANRPECEIVRRQASRSAL
jgi:hypothetical protein